ncbi:MAG: Rrf2 family transcriptional regulator [Phycisphaerales bacterium]|nr:Rrf2 family transcriptional regulator [Phycisphaerales bacterium]
MRLGRAATYAVLATTHLALRNRETPVQGRDIAEACAVPAGHLLKILQQLVRAQVLSSERGPAGGFSLRRAPSEITLLEVIEAIDGPINGDLTLRNLSNGKDAVRSKLEQTCQAVADHAKSVWGCIRVADLARESAA